ncbi:MAG: helix-turn-helix transcriptional regulator [Erysipelotrichaceae bacterium]|nr:helix-turn-helix transcriptional regulator [Erysipelotrichaceae bacterium]
MKIRELLLIARYDDEETQGNLAEKIGISNKKISKWELGEFNPTLHELRLLSNYFDLSINEMVDETEDDRLSIETKPIDEETPFYDMTLGSCYLVGLIWLYMSLEVYGETLNYLNFVIYIFLLIIYFMLFFLINFIYQYNIYHYENSLDN